MNAIDNKRINIFKLIYRLWLNIEKKRKIQLFFVFISMIVSGISELFILGTLIPFIQFISDPDLINKNQFFLNLFLILKDKFLVKYQIKNENNYYHYHLGKD